MFRYLKVSSVSIIMALNIAYNSNIVIFPNITVLMQFLRDFIFCEKGISRVFMIVCIFRNFISITVLMGLHRLFILLSLQLY